MLPLINRRHPDSCLARLDLMRRASSASTALERAVTYRDGLMIGVLSARPLRVRNLAGLELGRTFVWRGDAWWIDTPGEETKTNEAIEMPLPDELTSAIEAYLKDHRPFLCRRRGRWTAPIGNALWVSQDGSPLGIAVPISNWSLGRGRHSGTQ
jgi:hypothetical protein